MSDATGEPVTELYDLRVTVERIEGRSVCGMRIGDYFELRESARLHLPPDRHFCVYALGAVLPLLAAKQRQLAPGDWLERDSLVCCPDPEERLVMRVERLGLRRLSTRKLT
ncbi:MAG: TIGR04076 family protein [Pseudonocardia sp.]|nr:TIGR04076 family protein [Pseudonocardia sp.]